MGIDQGVISISNCVAECLIYIPTSKCKVIREIRTAQRSLEYRVSKWFIQNNNLVKVSDYESRRCKHCKFWKWCLFLRGGKLYSYLTGNKWGKKTQEGFRERPICPHHSSSQADVFGFPQPSLTGGKVDPAGPSAHTGSRPVWLNLRLRCVVMRGKV